MKEFRLSEKFLEEFQGKQPNWGFGTLSYITYKRTYARTKLDGTQEEFWETIKRVVEGCFTIQKQHCDSLRLPWDNRKAQRSAQIMFKKMWEFKFLPPGRGLWLMGTEAITEKGSGGLNNCGFVSSADIDIDFASPFCWAMDFLMLGVGIGFDTNGAGKLLVKKPAANSGQKYLVPDTREGWVEALRQTLAAYQTGNAIPEYDFSLIRPIGVPIKTFGGTSSGPEPLVKMLNSIKTLLDARIDEHITSVDIVDIFNFIGVAVVAGNVRRSAEIAHGDISDIDFIRCKDPKINLNELMDRRWSSNNSVFVKSGSDYKLAAEYTAINGEPGYIWLENARKYGRFKDTPNNLDYKIGGFNPCAEQGLESYELCVGGNTKLQTKNGLVTIKDAVGKSIEIWNGKEWSKVTPRITGQNRELFRVYISDGSYLDVTDNHKWLINTNRKNIKEIETKDLKIGQKLQEFNILNIDGIHEEFAFEYGLFTGDGYIDKNKIMLMNCNEDSKTQLLQIRGTAYKPQVLPNYKYSYKRFNLTKNLNFGIAQHLNDKTLGLHPYVFTWNRDSILQFLAGLIETDGTIQKNKNSQHFRIYGRESLIRDLQLLCRRVGINHASISLQASAGSKTNYGIRNYDMYYLTIPSHECVDIPTRVKKINTFTTGFVKNNAYLNSNLISKSKRQKIVKIEKLNGLHTTYCFDEPILHQGVFGNVLTKQCNLVETFPANHSSVEEFYETLKYAYLYAKTVTLVPSHDPRTNSVMIRNRRIGTSMSGIEQAKKKFGTYKFYKEFCDKGYEILKNYDKVYSDWLGIAKSIKITTVKPSGTVSLLAGATPGVHAAHSRFYYRTMRLAHNSTLVKALLDAGYRIEYGATEWKEEYFTLTGDNIRKEDWTSFVLANPIKIDEHGNWNIPNFRGTVVAYFPIEEKDFTKSKHEQTIWEQAENTAKMQYYWSDNAVSVTINFKKSEASQIQEILEHYDTRLKTISFLPLEEHGYAQAPYITISEKEYKEYSSTLKDIKFSNITNVDKKIEGGCETDKCILPGGS